MSETVESKVPRLVIPLPNGAEEMALRQIVAVGETEAFRMGARGYDTDEEPVHSVCLKRAYWMAETPVTQAQFRAWTDSPAYLSWLEANHEKLIDGNQPHQNSFSGFEDLPAEMVSWWEAKGFCEWLGASGAIEQVEGGSGFDFRFGSFDLPTEAEWEYACRAGADTEYWSGDGEAALREVGWFKANSKERTHPVREIAAANPFGLYAMHGNVWEWCQDYYWANAFRVREGLARAPLRDDVPPLGGETQEDLILRGLQEFAARDLSVPGSQLSEDEASGLRALERVSIEEVDSGNEGWKRCENLAKMALAGNWDRVDLGLLRQLQDVFSKGASQGGGDRSYRVLRGGSWNASASRCRSAYRSRFGAGNRGRFRGFRLCLFPGPPSQQGPSRRSESDGGLGAEAERGAGRRRDAAAKATRNAAAEADILSEPHSPERDESEK